MSKEFTVTEDHLKLLERAALDDWYECEFGAPSMDPKRPFGNSDVLDDIEEITGKAVTTKEAVQLLHEVAALYEHAKARLLLQRSSVVGLTLKTGWRNR